MCDIHWLPVLRHIAAKTIHHSARATPQGIGSSVNATLVLNECCIIFVVESTKPAVTATSTVMKQLHLTIRPKSNYARQAIGLIRMRSRSTDQQYIVYKEPKNKNTGHNEHEPHYVAAAIRL